MKGEMMKHPVELAMLLSGIVFWILARRHRTEIAPPMPSWNPAHWKPFASARPWFRSPGFLYYELGTWLVVGAGLLAIVRRWLIGS